MTISSWLNFGRPAPPGRGSAAGRKFLAPPYYSQRTVFASLWALFSVIECFVTEQTVCCVESWATDAAVAGSSKRHHASLFLLLHAQRIQSKLHRRFRSNNHGLRIRILRILKFPKIHEFLRILELSILKFIRLKLSHSSPLNTDKHFVPKAALNFWIKNSVMSTIQDSLTRQQFCMIMSSLLQSLWIAYSFIVFHSVGVLNCPLFPFNSVVDCGETVLNCS